MKVLPLSAKTLTMCHYIANTCFIGVCIFYNLGEDCYRNLNKGRPPGLLLLTDGRSRRDDSGEGRQALLGSLQDLRGILALLPQGAQPQEHPVPALPGQQRGAARTGRGCRHEEAPAAAGCAAGRCGHCRTAVHCRGVMAAAAAVPDAHAQ